MSNNYTPPDLSFNIVLLEATIPDSLPLGNVVLCGPDASDFQIIWSVGFETLLFGGAKVYRHQYVRSTGVRSQAFGLPYLQGGVKYLLPRSYDTSVHGKPALVNTTANQQVLTKGIAISTVVPAPIVSPHMIYARGIYGTAFGSAKLIPTPVLKQKGVNHFEAGNTTVWYHTRPLDIIGFESYATGYPKVFDPAQTIQQQPFNRTAVFGDTYAKNVWTFASNAGAIDSAALSPWAVIENRDRSYLAKGFLSQSFGQQSIRNKSPSIFFHGLPAPIFYNQAIGYRIRTVTPTGFDRLSLGKPSVIKTPQLLPRSYIATQFGVQWISNHIRYVENHSKNYGAAGEPTVWFRFRYATPKSWLSQAMGDKLTVTHGVRELIGRGFICQAYGNSWVSRGRRFVEPKPIPPNVLSMHTVGGSRKVVPIGYIATLFGTRIIPEIQALYALGFTGVFGLAVADLATKNVKPIGYLSAGEQPAFRWGRQIAYNSSQYVTQEFIGDSGLVPPKWSEWTAIENRNKNIGVIGSLMQRFGYNQIDNNARLIEPQGLIATRFDKSMIAYRIRKLPLQGMEPPYMSDWLVVHNDARVIRPSGEVQSLFGMADAVKTRRYFDRIGRIESFESGTAMVAYRIRTLDIEKRYSIEPPTIRLPSVDLHTRYIDCRGFETAKYGLPSLSIHFNIITTRWSHKEQSGRPALHNVTPELLTRGHDSQEYGNTSLRTEWRHMYVQGDNSNLFGRMRISDTKQFTDIRGWLDSTSSQHHTVTKTGTNPFVLQNIWLNDESNSNNGDGHGIGYDEYSQVPKPGINQNVLQAKGFYIPNFGTAFIYSNTITVFGGIAIDGVSKLASVFNGDRTINLDGMVKIDSEIKTGKPGLTPHTIWAVMEAPEQAKDNHPLPDGGRLHYVNSKPDGTGSVFGIPRLESTIRSIRPVSFHSSFNSIGIPDVDFFKRFITPDSFRSARLGMPSIPFTMQTIVLRQGISRRVEFGQTKLSRPPYLGPQTIRPIGHASLDAGRHISENWERDLYATGFNTLLMGASKSDDSPFMWQGLRIGEHVPMSIGGTDTALYGNAFISLRVRDVLAEGFDAFRSEYTLSAFSQRMTVSNNDKQLSINSAIAVLGIEANSAIGYQDIKLGQHYIRPDGNSDQYRKGGYHA